MRERRRALIAGSFLVSLLAALAYVEGWPQWEAARTPASVDLRSGSVLFVPAEGNRCRQRQIDNATWRIRGNTIVGCTDALAKAEGVESDGPWAGSRVDVIRNAFRTRK